MSREKKCELLFAERGLHLVTCGEPGQTRTFRVHDTHGEELGVARLKAVTSSSASWRAGLQVSYIHVSEHARKARIGTLIYDALLAHACEEGKPLVSDDLRSPFAEAFWRKQRQKKRAVCARGPGEVWEGPLQELQDKLDRGLITKKQHADAVRKLPKPKQRKRVFEHGESYVPAPEWGCKRYEIRRPCSVETLAGLRGKKR